MKKSILLLMASFVLSCGSKKTVSGTKAHYVIESPCPPNGNCSFEIIKDKSLIIKNDDTGRFYYQMEDTPGKNVVKYSYKKTTNSKLQDASYTEEIIFETDSSITDFKTIGEDDKVLFGVHCFCRGKAGFYKLKYANIIYNKKKMTIKLPEKIVDGQLTKFVEISFK